MVIDGEAVGGLRRTAKEGSFLSNTSQGGTGEYVPVTELSPDQKGIAELCAKVVGFGMTGIDIMGPADKPHIIEYNDAPQLDWFADKFKVPVHTKIVDHMEKSAQKMKLRSDFGPGKFD
jgi:ribosomal protein S6--L-glutamate ligase